MLSCYYKNAAGKNVPAAICSIQAFGDMLGFNPHLHILAADRGFGCSGIFYASTVNLDTSTLESLFRYKILSMLKKKGLISDRVIELIHSCFIASITSHIPNNNEQMVRYTGYYSNVCRGEEEKSRAVANLIMS